MSILSVRNLILYYRTRRGLVKAVDDVSFDIERGKTLALVGESGCGKTSTASAILRILPRNVGRYEGQVLLDDVNIMYLNDEEFRKTVRWRAISIVFQGAMNALNPTTQVGQQVAEPLRIHLDIAEEEAIAEAKASLQRVGLPGYIANRYPHELSGGMKQRVVIAMALVMKPKLVILDEPTSALDVMTQASIINLLKELQAKESLSYLFITHDLGLASELTDHLGIMYAGKLAEIGLAKDVYVKPQHPYTQMLMSSIPRLRGSETPQSIPGTPPDLIEPPLGCRFHPRCPYAFEPCGWSAAELAAEIKKRLPKAESGEPGPLPEIKSMKAKDDGHLVMDLGASNLTSAEPFLRFFEERKSATPAFRAVKEVKLADGKVTVRLHAAEEPQMLGSEQRAACWLLSQGDTS